MAESSCLPLVVLLLAAAAAAAPDLARQLDLFDPARAASDAASTNVTVPCAQAMAAFADGLATHQDWAAKMFDASGRYSTGFLWGNNFWLGSSDLCMTLEENAVVPAVFSVARFSLDVPRITAKTRTVHVGMCLPRACGLEDLRVLVGAGLTQLEQRNATLEAVRSPQLDEYRFYADGTFVVLALVCALVLALMVAGSIVDARKPPPPAAPATPECEDGSVGKPPIALDVVPAPKRKMALSAFLVCFSVQRNARAIFDQSVGGDTLAPIHGLRFLSMVWVILGHSCIVIFKYADNTDFRGVVEREFLFQTISNAAFSVDTFFFISGLLFSFLYFRTTAKVDLNKITKATGLKSKGLQFFGLLAYRFGRLTAPYMFVLGVVQVSMRWFYHKSVFEPPTLDHENCPQYWWRNLLYINTLFPVKDMCMLWSWYLADDTQFYVLGALLMMVAVERFRTAALVFGGLMFSSWCTTAYIAFNNDHNPSMDDPLALFDKIYDKPWTRLGPYLVGMATGWLLFTMNCRLRLGKGGAALGWSVCAAVMLSLLYGLYDAQLDAYTSAAYSSLSHTAWALGTAWVIVACSTGHGGFVGRLLSAPSLYPMSRVTYCAYLIHPLIIRMMVMYVDSPLHLARTTVMLLFLGHVVLSYLIAFAISVSFEAPVVALLRLISPKKE
ncbi:nose resistant to fluoxetine protein 6 [Neocloeon triangulifer]|uniref:nose resistant to fluoxetine protein 6 n=1 Tax=Neocloeon triangulifer TaxID=2078957 RepID=UPI00286F0665|nr:nose resistant to fluoxetine protein 6 [Neocloeon triangulifer]